MQQDGTAPHYARRVRNFLGAKYNRRWVGRGGPVDWTPSSPDLTPLNFFLGTSKECCICRTANNKGKHDGFAVFAELAEKFQGILY